VNCLTSILAALALGQGVIVAEPTHTSATLQARLTDGTMLVNDDLDGLAGVARFELSEGADFHAVRSSRWLRASPDADFVLRHLFDGLAPGRTYYYRVRVGADRSSARPMGHGSFRTLPRRRPVHFVVVSCLNLETFRTGKRGPKRGRELGLPALDTIGELQPDFVVFTGDTVYYDSGERARTLPQMRARWHRQFATARFRSLFSKTATFWQVDDHDFRYDDADLTSPRRRSRPSPALGERVLREQVPLPETTWRTFRVGEHAQVWLLESRLHRSPNRMPDGPRKSLWGAEQREWLKVTLRASPARHRIVITPTPLVGPDDVRKRDNHTNPRGFRYEGDDFHAWAASSLPPGRLLVITGDRHWQYHSIHPFGTEEISVGALTDQSSRMGRRPGDPKGTDPDATVRQPYTAQRRKGGFLEVSIDGERLSLTLRDVRGRVTYRTTR